MRHPLTQLLVFVIAAAAYFSGSLDDFDNQLMELRSRLHQRPATDQIVIVAINESSLQELDVWPWPRRYHAGVIKQLLAAGAQEIALDIDLSSRSNPEDDEALASVLSESQGRVILPIFRQLEMDSTGRLSAIQSEPLRSFRDSVRLASFNVRPDSDGIVRQLAFFDVWNERSVPLFATLAARRTVTENDTYHVDFSIDPKTIRHLSYADVLAGRFNPELVAGKLVLIGATAVQLGDMVTVPLYRALPGIVLQALAIQSLLENHAFKVLGPFFVLVAALMIALIAGTWLPRCSWRIGLVIVVLGSLTLVTAAFVLHSVAAMFLPPSTAILTLLLSFAATIFSRVSQQDLLLLTQGLAIRRRDIQMRMIVDNSFDAIITVDDEGRIRTVNPAAEILFGSSADKLVGASLESLLHDPEDSQRQFQLGREFEPGTHRVATFNQENGVEIQLDLAVSRMILRDEKLTIVIARDISKQVKAEHALIYAKEIAELSARSKTEFLHNMSHELRTPLNAIIGFSEIMQKGMFGPLGNPRYVEYANDIRSSGDHLLAIINDILDIAKIESGRLQLSEEEFDLVEVINSAVRMICDRSVRANVMVSVKGVDEMPSLRGDRRLIKQTLLNLIDNAVKFTPGGGQVEIAAGLDDSGSVLITVSDTGIGIPVDQIPHAMEPFGQIDGSLSRKYEGTGLGLPLAKRFVEMHGGSLTLESMIDCGTTVKISLPAERVLDSSATLLKCLAAQD